MEAPMSSSLGAMGPLLQKLDSLLAFEYRLPKPLKDGIELLKEDMEEISAALVKQSMVDSPSHKAKYWMDEVRELSYDIEDCIDCMTRRHTDADAKIRSVHRQRVGRIKITRLSKTPKPCTRIAKIAELRALVREAIERHERYQLDDCASSASRVLTWHGRVPALYGGSANFLVGIDESKTKLIKLLTDETERQLKMVSIVGSAGVGKTTLAKEIYCELGGQFDCRAFVRASKTPDMWRLLGGILSQVQRRQRPSDACTVQKLIDDLREHLQYKRISYTSAQSTFSLCGMKSAHHRKVYASQSEIDAFERHAAEIDAFERHAAELLLDLLDNSSDHTAPEFLSLVWTRRLVDSCLICLEEFRALLFSCSAAAVTQPPLDRLIDGFLTGAIKALDLCNAVGNGVDLVRQWRKHIAIAAGALASPDPAVALRDYQICRARKALTGLTIHMLEQKDGGGGSVVSQRNRSFGRGNRDSGSYGHGHGHGHQSQSSSSSSSKGSSGSESTTGFSPLSWSVSHSWSAARQLQAMGEILSVPRVHDITATGGLASAVYTMGAVLFVVAWALVAAIPCQGRGLHAPFSVPRNFLWSGPATKLYERIIEESETEKRKTSCGLLKEIHQIERCSRKLGDITDAAQFPLPRAKEAEVREAAQELVQVGVCLKDGLDPLERQVREMFRRIVRARTEILELKKLSGALPPQRPRRAPPDLKPREQVVGAHKQGQDDSFEAEEHLFLQKQKIQERFKAGLPRGGRIQ